MKRTTSFVLSILLLRYITLLQ